MLIVVGFLFTFHSICADLKSGIIYINKFNDIPKLQTIDKIGFKSCARRCIYHKFCYAFNYWSKLLICDLFADEGLTLFRNIAYTDFSNISSWTLVSTFYRLLCNLYLDTGRYLLDSYIQFSLFYFLFG